MRTDLFSKIGILEIICTYPAIKIGIHDFVWTYLTIKIGTKVIPCANFSFILQFDIIR